MERKSRVRAESGAFVFIVAAVVVVANILAIKVLHRARFDLTYRHLYTLSEGTKRTLGRLHDQLTVNVYWSPDQPAPAGDDERLIREQLDEYVAAGNGNVVVHFVHTDNDTRQAQATDAQCTQRALQAVDVRQQQATVQRVFRCVTMEYLRSHERIDFVNPGVEGMEYQLTSLVKKMVDPERTIGFLTGHDEATPEQAMPYLSRVISEAHLGYTTRTVDLHGGDEPISSDLKGLVIVNPTRRIEERELRRINEYLMHGGSVAVFASGANVTGGDTRPTAAASTDNLNALLDGYGLSINSDIVIDARSADAIEQIEEGRVRIRMFTFPVIADEGLDATHYTVFRLPGIITPFVSSLNINRGRATENGAHLTIIGRTSEVSVAQSGSFSLDAVDLIQRRDTVFGGSGAHGPYVVAAAVEGPLRSAFAGATPPSGDAGVSAAPTDVPSHASADHPARILVVGSGKMFSMDQLRAIAPLQQGMPTNVQMLLDTFDWLSQDPDLLAVRAKDVSEPELRADISAWKMNVFKWGSIVGIPLLVGLLGLVLSILRAKRRAEITL